MDTFDIMRGFIVVDFLIILDLEEVAMLQSVREYRSRAERKDDHFHTNSGRLILAALLSRRDTAFLAFLSLRSILTAPSIKPIDGVKVQVSLAASLIEDHPSLFFLNMILLMYSGKSKC